MNVDTDSLEQLNLRTRDGAEQAGAAFADVVGTETRIGATKIRLLSQHDLVAELLDESTECVEFLLEGPLSGTIVLAFENRPQVRASDDPPGGEAAETVTGQLIQAFVSEWEREIDGTVTVEASTVVEDPLEYEFALDSIGGDAESAPVFQSTIRAVDDSVAVRLYVALDAPSLDRLLEAAAVRSDDEFGRTTDGSGERSLLDDEDVATTVLPLDKLSVFADITREGTKQAAERVTQMTGVQTRTEVAGVNFTPVDDIAAQLEGEKYVGTTIEFDGKPSGHLVILFRAAAAEQIAEAMLPMEPSGEGLTELHESALEELGNIMASGFIDGWANVLQTSVEHTPPEYTDDMDMALVEIVTDQLGPFQTHAYTIESRIETDEFEFDCEIHALPDEAKLSAALDTLLVERREETTVDPKDVL